MSSTTKSDRLTGRVASILNAHELVINVGSEAGVRQGQIFAILAGTPIEVKDPATGEVLDTLDREKVRVQVKEVRPRISICTTFRRTPGMPAISIADFMRKARRETLSIDDESTPAPLTEEDSYVKINDRVVAVPD